MVALQCACCNLVLTVGRTNLLVCQSFKSDLKGQKDTLNLFKPVQSYQQVKIGATGVTTDVADASLGQVQVCSVKTV